MGGLSYMLAHVVVLTGAICFRSHALLKTILFLLVVILGLAAAEIAAERLLFPDAFSWTKFDSIRSLPLELMPWFTAHWLNVFFVSGAFCWLVCIAYACLCDHEVTDGV